MAARKDSKNADRRLARWLVEVLKVQAKDATLDLGGGRECMVKLDGNRLIAYEYVGDDDQEVWLSVMEFTNAPG